MCRVRASAFLACATCLTISCSANPRSLDEGKVLVWSRDTARQGPTQRDSIRPQFEPSYVVFSVLGRYAPKPGPGPHHILLEANVAPPFYIVSWGHNAIVLTPKIILRQFAGQSWPVRPPSFMPRATYYHWWPDRSAGLVQGLLLGPSGDSFGGGKRLTHWGTVAWELPGNSDMSLFLNWYLGQDYYNNNYDQYRRVLRFGIAGSRGRGRDDRAIPRPPAAF